MPLNPATREFLLSSAGDVFPQFLLLALLFPHLNLQCKSVSHSAVPGSLWPVDCSPPGSSAHGILQARILEWVAIPFSRGTFLTRGPNPGLLASRRILYHLSHQRNLLKSLLVLQRELFFVGSASIWFSLQSCMDTATPHFSLWAEFVSVCFYCGS